MSNPRVLFCLLFLSGTVRFTIAQSPNVAWVRYSATYTYTWTSEGKTHQTIGRELRSEDGSLFTTIVTSGQTQSAQLWQACGQFALLNYSSKQANISARPRKHTLASPDKPVGEITLSGIKAVGYPIHVRDGAGTVWMDLNDDIVLKFEVNAVVNGKNITETRQLTSIDLASPIDASVMQIPKGFQKIMAPTGVPLSCSNNN